MNDGISLHSAAHPRATVANRNRSGFRSSDFDVYIGRPSKWGNPFMIGRDGTREQVIAKYRNWLASNPVLLRKLPELVGKRLVCFCKPQACHGDVLLEMLEKLRPEVAE